ncbi:hypothetical protein GGR54DRAFT_640039 [Hypoxylon sp. NC1633]|nr:hypothetical protein GGR54DRAFT_640039 [Hypoxylon sp. NC1633]
MSTLRKKQSVILGAKPTREVPGTPSSKSDQGGGARLDVSFDDLSLEKKTPPAAIYEPPHARNGRSTPVVAQHSRRLTAKSDDDPFQVGQLASDGDVFSSPHRAPRSPTVGPSAGTQGLTMQGVIPTMMQPVRTLRPRASAARVGGVDAQAFYPATACVFVANLPEFVADSRLELELTKAFSKFGIVFVKIRRDQRNMPFAFCQFTKDQDAQEAVTAGKGTVIEGRSCRTEMVKANRSFVFFHVHGETINTDEARVQMSSFGPISKCEELHPQLQDALHAKGGVLVEFTTYDPSRDVIAAYRRHPAYRVVPYDLKRPKKTTKVDQDEAWLQKYEIDRRSIFVGNLPADETNLEDLLRSVAEEIGDVENVHVVRRDGRNGQHRPTAFGFVEFADPNMADVAVDSMNGKLLGEFQLRVERKASREPASVRRFQPDASVRGQNGGSPLHTNRRVRSQKSLARVKDSEPATPSHTQLAAANVPLPPSGSSTGTVPSASSHRQGIHPFEYMPHASNQVLATMDHPYGMPPPYATPHMGTGTYPTSSHVTPTMPMHGMGMNPYYGTPYGWVTPYLQDPNLAAMGYYQPPPYSSPLAAHNEPASEDEGNTTPTKHNGGGHRRKETSGRSETS